jgi:hypothetical protein
MIVLAGFLLAALRGSSGQGQPGEVFPAAASRTAQEAASKPPKPPLRVSPDLLPANDGAQAETQANPYLAADPEAPSRLVAVWEEALFSDGGARGIGVAVSTNGGAKWQAGILPGVTVAAAGPFERAASPWVAFGPNHRVHVATVGFDSSSPASGVLVSTSLDGGLTFGDPATLPLANGEIAEGAAVAVDTRPDSPRFGRVYVSWYARQADGSTRFYVAGSDDGGASFGAAVSFRGGVRDLAPLPLIGPGGVVHFTWLHQGIDNQGNFFPILDVPLTSSSNGGSTWSPAVATVAVRVVGVPGIHTAGGRPSAAIDDAGNFYLTWQDDRFTPGVDQVVVSRSTDGGVHWSDPVRVSDGPDDAPSFTPALAVDAAGRVAVSYTTLRNDPKRSSLADVYLAISTDGAPSFGASRRVTPKAFKVGLAASYQGAFLGEVQGLIAAGGSFRPLFAATLGKSKKRKSNQVDIWTTAIKP